MGIETKQTTTVVNQDPSLDKSSLPNGFRDNVIPEGAIAVMRNPTCTTFSTSPGVAAAGRNYLNLTIPYSPETPNNYGAGSRETTTVITINESLGNFKVTQSAEKEAYTVIKRGKDGTTVEHGVYQVTVA